MMITVMARSPYVWYVCPATCLFQHAEILDTRNKKSGSKRGEIKMQKIK